MAAVHETAATMFGEFAFRRLPLALMLGLSMIGFACGPGWSTRIAAWPWLVSLVVVGLPHGAADLAVSRMRLHGGPLVGRAMVYMMLMAGAAAAFTLAPAATLATFVGLSGWHFGASHAESQMPSGSRIPARLLGLAAVGRGGFVLGVPLAAWPAATADVAAAVIAIAGGAVPCTPDIIRRLGLTLVATACVALGAEAFACRRRPAAIGRACAAAGDLAVIGLLGLTTDPLFAVGIYFLCWHAWRQMRPLAAAIGGAEPHGWRSLAVALVAIHAAALPLLVPTWVTLAALSWLLPEGRLAHSGRGLAILSLAVYVVVTPAHDLLNRLDWRRPRDASSRVAAAGGLRACNARSACCSS